MGINTPKKNRIDQITAEQTLIDGFNKHAAAIPTMVIDGAIADEEGHRRDSAITHRLGPGGAVDQGNLADGDLRRTRRGATRPRHSSRA